MKTYARQSKSSGKSSSRFARSHAVNAESTDASSTNQENLEQTADSGKQTTPQKTWGSMTDNVGRSSTTQISRPSQGLVLQPKLIVGAEDDQYEQEADHVADQVVETLNSAEATPTVQRSARTSAALRLQMKPRLQKTGQKGGLVSRDLQSRIQSAKGNGRSLDSSLQQRMGQAMDHDFSGVKIHTGAQSDQLNQSIQAKAFTTGQDVFFSKGAYNPATTSGQRLIAHELTHVVQQKSGGGQGDTSQAIQRVIEEIPLHPSSSKEKYGKNDEVYDDNGVDMLRMETDDYPYMNLTKLEKYKKLMKENKPESIEKNWDIHHGPAANPVVNPTSDFDASIGVTTTGKGGKMLTVSAGQKSGTKQASWAMRKGKRMREVNPQHVSSHPKNQDLVGTHGHVYETSMATIHQHIESVITSMEGQERGPIRGKKLKDRKKVGDQLREKMRLPKKHKPDRPEIIRDDELRQEKYGAVFAQMPSN